MTNFFTSIFLLLFLSTMLIAQDTETITLGYGSGYSRQVIYNLSDNNNDSYRNDEWDIAFTVDEGVFGIHINESSPFNGEADALYRVNTIDFADVLVEADLTDSLYNGELTWAIGAFNVFRDSSDVDDFGWGIYNPQTKEVEEGRIHALRLRTGLWKKIIISFSDDTYHVKYANLDNSDEKNIDIKKADYVGGTLALLSITKDKVLPKLEAWDLFVGRYSILIDAGGAFVPYTVVGVLTNGTTQVAEFNGVDPSTMIATEDELDENWETDISAIGSDWKFFNLSAGGWVLNDTVVYYAKTSDAIYKLVFSRFGGSSDGSLDFEKTKLDIKVSSKDLFSNQFSLNVFPNPSVNGKVNIGYELEAPKMLDVRLIDSMGRVVWTGDTYGHTGFNVSSIDVSTVPNGFYTLILMSDDGFSSEKLMIGK